jgi:hypothetical protein
MPQPAFLEAATATKPGGSAHIGAESARNRRGRVASVTVRRDALSVFRLDFHAK